MGANKAIVSIILLFLFNNTLVYCQNDSVKNPGLECRDDFRITNFTIRKKDHKNWDDINIKGAEKAKVFMWKVVVNRAFDYHAKPKDQSSNWEWKFATNMWIPKDLDVQNGVMDDKGKGIIEKMPLPDKNSDFGSTHTSLSVTKDNPLETTNTIEDDDKKIQVFYEKDGLGNPDGVNDGITPNWFYYWKENISELIPSDLKVLAYDWLLDIDGNASIGDEGWYLKDLEIDIKFDPTAPLVEINSDGYAKASGFTKKTPKFAEFDDGDDVPKGRVLIDTDIVITVGQWCSEVTGNKVLLGCSFCDYKNSYNMTGDVYTGIHAFMATIVHELQHVKMFSDFWKDKKLIQGVNSPNKTDSDRDEYPDAWETGAAASPYNFTVADIYEIGFDQDKYNLAEFESGLLPGPTPGATSGTNYEELTIRNYVNSYVTDEVKLDWNKLDWSFIGKEYYLLFQGKQWVKD